MEYERVVVNGNLIRGDQVQSVTPPGGVSTVWIIKTVDDTVIMATGNVSMEYKEKKEEEKDGNSKTECRKSEQDTGSKRSKSTSSKNKG